MDEFGEVEPVHAADEFGEVEPVQAKTVANPRPQALPRSMLQSFNSAMENTGTGMLAPRLLALRDAANTIWSGQPVEHPLDTLSAAKEAYDRSLPGWQQEYEADFKANPKTSLAGSILAGLPAAPRTLPQAAAMGLGQGLASSRDLTNVPETLKDAAVGAGAGLLGGGAAALPGALAARAERGVAQATAAQLAKSQAARDAAISSASGALGGKTAGTFKMFDRISEILASPHSTDEMKAAAQAQLNDPEFIQALNSARQEYLTKAPQQMAELRAARAAVDEARGIDAEQAAQEALAHPVKEQLLPRALKYAGRAIPVMVGGSVGGVPGAVAGHVLGAALGHPGTAISNMLKSPAVRKLGWELVGGLGNGATLPVEQAVQRGAGQAPEMDYIQALVNALRAKPTVATVAPPVTLDEQ